jgi:hypothetical protein
VKLHQELRLLMYSLETDYSSPECLLSTTCNGFQHSGDFHLLQQFWFVDAASRETLLLHLQFMTEKRRTKAGNSPTAETRSCSGGATRRRFGHLGCLSTGSHRALGPSDKHGRCFCSQANSGSYVPCPHTFGFITRDLQLIIMAGATTHKHEDRTRKLCITPHGMPQHRLSNCCSNKRGAWFDVFLYLDLRQAESLVFCQMVVLPR